MNTITTVGRPYGHVPGRSYLDVEIEASSTFATLTISWGSAQGFDEEHGREEYSARGSDLAGAIERVTRIALDEHTDARDDELRRYVRTAESRALSELEEQAAA